VQQRGRETGALAHGDDHVEGGQSACEIIAVRDVLSETVTSARLVTADQSALLSAASW
jgi:hypothetical protein